MGAVYYQTLIPNFGNDAFDRINTSYFDALEDITAAFESRASASFTTPAKELGGKLPKS